MSKNLKVASLFSGIGGIDLGFKQAGFDIVWANDIDKDAAVTYNANFEEKVLIEKNIKEIDVQTIPDFDILTAGFPCQPFSIVGRQKGFNDPRGNLFFEIARVVDVKRPPVIFLENVQNLVEHDNGKTFLVIYNTLVQFGYFVKYKVMDSKEYGNVPQQRRRIFIVAFLNYSDCEKFKFPEPVELTVSLNEILERSQKHSDIYYYNKSNFYFYDLQKIVTDEKALYRINDSGVSRKKYFICPTLLANMGTFPDRVPVIRDDFGIRKITPLECLALQGFPPDFKFPGIPLNSAYKQAGNTVCVPVVKRIAERIKEVLFDSKITSDTYKENIYVATRK